jgi:biopolymer transport protein ExbD
MRNDINVTPLVDVCLVLLIRTTSTNASSCGSVSGWVWRR